MEREKETVSVSGQLRFILNFYTQREAAELIGTNVDTFRTWVRKDNPVTPRDVRSIYLIYLKVRKDRPKQITWSTVVQTIIDSGVDVSTIAKKCRVGELQVVCWRDGTVNRSKPLMLRARKTLLKMFDDLVRKD